VLKTRNLLIANAHSQNPAYRLVCRNLRSGYSGVASLHVARKYFSLGSVGFGNFETLRQLRLGPASSCSCEYVRFGCSNWNPFENSEKRQNAANLCVFSYLQQASQASDVGSIPIARSKSHVYGPKTSFTQRSEDIAYTFGPKGVCKGCKAFSSRSI
jgi:hypothetical protein